MYTGIEYQKNLQATQALQAASKDFVFCLMTCLREMSEFLAHTQNKVGSVQPHGLFGMESTTPIADDVNSASRLGM